MYTSLCVADSMIFNMWMSLPYETLLANGMHNFERTIKKTYSNNNRHTYSWYTLTHGCISMLYWYRHTIVGIFFTTLWCSTIGVSVNYFATCRIVPFWNIRQSIKSNHFVSVFSGWKKKEPTIHLKATKKIEQSLAPNLLLNIHLILHILCVDTVAVLKARLS